MSLLSTTVTLPSLRPRLVDPLWLQLDEPRDEDKELTNFEARHKMAKAEVANRKAPTAIGLSLTNRQGQYLASDLCLFGPNFQKPRISSRSRRQQ